MPRHVYALLPASRGGQGSHDTLDGGSSVSVMILRPARQGISGVLGGCFHQRVQKLAGHKTITMSTRYSQLSPEHRLSVIVRIVSIRGE
jgi:hypothetical protein